MRPLDPEQVYRILFTDTGLLDLLDLIDFIYFRDLLKKTRDGQAFSPVHIIRDVRVHAPLKSYPSSLRSPHRTTPLPGEIQEHT